MSRSKRLLFGTAHGGAWSDFLPRSVQPLWGKPSLDRTSNLCQSVRALTYLRNELIHFKAEWMHEPKVHANVSATLKGKVKPSAFLDDKDLFPRAWATHSCTRWAVNTARAFGDSMAQHLDQKNPFQQFAERMRP